MTTPTLTPGPDPVDHPSVSDRAAHGRAARGAVPRSALGEWHPDADRPDPVDLLQEQGESRVPELLPIRYGRMSVSEFTFYRGAAYVMASDLARTPSPGLMVQLCGDAHLSNFGAFAAPDRRLVFSLNDFDETLPGPFEWDVKRLVASFEVAARENNLDGRQRRLVNLAVARSYREAMGGMAGKKTLDMWYARLDVDDLRRELKRGAKPKQVKRFEKNLAKARAKDGMRALDKLVEVVDGKARIVSDPPLIVSIGDLLPDAEAHQVDEWMRAAIRGYRRTLQGDHRRLLDRFRYCDAARKVVGVGSVGTRAWIVLMLGNDTGDPMFLQCKEAQASVLEPFVRKSAFANHGQRVVEGQRLMQSASDIMLGWVRVNGIDGVERDFYVRQLWDGKGSALVEAMDPAAMTKYARVCGWTLARAHARSGDPVAIASYLGKGDHFDQAMAAFADTYADQNQRDHAALQGALDSSKVTAELGL